MKQALTEFLTGLHVFLIGLVIGNRPVIANIKSDSTISVIDADGLFLWRTHIISANGPALVLKRPVGAIVAECSVTGNARCGNLYEYAAQVIQAELDERMDRQEADS